ncbi:MAG: single-stranded DNA-binding protein [Nitrospira sp.]|nr:single-stranded DNA-binding protein [Nitrospira sp.]
MTYIHVELVGRVATVPTSVMVGGRQVTNLRVAIDRPAHASTAAPHTPLFFSVCIWHHSPKQHMPTLRKGDLIKVAGRLDTRHSSHTGLTYTQVVTDRFELLHSSAHTRAA